MWQELSERWRKEEAGRETREVAEAVTSVGFHFGANQMFVHNYNLVFGSRRYLPII